MLLGLPFGLRARPLGVTRRTRTRVSRLTHSYEGIRHSVKRICYQRFHCGYYTAGTWLLMDPSANIHRASRLIKDGYASSGWRKLLFRIQLARLEYPIRTMIGLERPL